MAERVFRLSKREVQVLRLRGEGRSCKEIGMGLGISTHTVKSYLRRIFPKIGARSSAEAVYFVWFVRGLSLKDDPRRKGKK